MIATPFKGGMDCWNGGDWMVILSAACLFFLSILLFFIRRQIKNSEEMLDEKYDVYRNYKKMEKGFGRK